MANTTLSTNMNLPVPVVGQDSGPQYAYDQNTCFSLIDSHNHSPGSGVQITPSGLNISSTLTMNDNILSNIQALALVTQISDASVQSIYSKGGDLFWTNGGGTPVQLTVGDNPAGGAGTITGLPSGTASASFAASTFIFQSATNTAANIDGRSLILRLSSASSNALTLSPPAALSGGSYQIFLPTIPAATGVVTIDTSGNMSSALPVSYLIEAAALPAYNLSIIRGWSGGVNNFFGEGFTGAKLATGTNRITFTTAFADIPSCTVTASTTTGVPVVAYLDGTSNPPATTDVVILTAHLDGTATDQPFYFTIIGRKV